MEGLCVTIHTVFDRVIGKILIHFIVLNLALAHYIARNII